MSESASAQTVSERRAVEDLQPADGPVHVHVHVLILSQTRELSQTFSYFKRSSMLQKPQMREGNAVKNEQTQPEMDGCMHAKMNRQRDGCMDGQVGECLDVWMDVWVLDGWMNAWMAGWVDGWVTGWMDGCMDGLMDGHVYYFE